MRSQGWFLLTSLLVHAVGFSLARLAPAPRPGAREYLEVRSIDLEVAPTFNAEATAGKAPIASERVSGATVPHASRVRSSASAPTAAPPEGEAPAEAPSPAPQRPQGDGFDPLEGGPSAGHGVPGLGGPSLWSLPGLMPGPQTPSAAPTAPGAPRAPDRDIAGKVVRDALRERDKSVGIDLPAAGTVASTVASAVRSTDTPLLSRATFSVQLDGAGHVRAVSVLSATEGNVDVWKRAASAAASLLAGRRLAMTSAYAKGATVFVEVTSVNQFPSGSKSPRANALLHERKRGAGDLKLHGGEENAGVSAGGDASDIGAHESRVVSVKFRVEAAR